MEAILANSKKKFVVLVVLVALNCFGGLRSTAQPLPASEVAALRQIASKLRKGDWDFNSNPCGRTGGWAVSTVNNDVANNVTCRCTNSICNVVSIQLKAQNLTGVLPEEFADLPLLEQIDLSRNYINGSIPAAWGTLHLTKLSLLGNRISGQIPKELGNITTLMELILESNSLNGPIPSELGNLSRLSRLLLCGNNFIGELPVTFGKLTNLTDFRIDGNGISGKIPDFIGNWTQLDRFDMQGTLMEGPIPSNIRLLRNLTELRISDLNGLSTGFPNLQNLTNFARLVLRNCSISDVIPTYLWNMVNIKTL